MLMLVPDAGQVEALEGKFGVEFLDNVVGSLERRNVELGSPKWEFESASSFSSTLQPWGLPQRQS